jgi:hypothetical protein
MRRNTLVMLLLAIVFGVGAVFLSNIWLSTQKQPGAAIASTPAGEMSSLQPYRCASAIG